ncbi:MAG: hypothetical protein MR224_04870 [Dorea sp.]|nr:hypothetical protein [Dorea sp.]MDY2814524.1 hypothetical protein [Dorea sp.]
MLRRIKNINLILGVTVQILAMLFYSFSEASISGYFYMVVWVICALFMKSSVNYGKRI